MSYNTHVTRNTIHAGNVYRAGYCELHYLLLGHERDGYNRGVYGWNYDLYYIGGAAITTGYRNTVGSRIKGAETYENRARDVWKDDSIPYDEKRGMVNALLYELLTNQG